MSSSVSAPPLRLECRSSRWLVSAVAGVHGGALLALVPLPLAWWLKLLLMAGVVAQGVITWRRHVTFSSSRSVKRLVWTAENRWELCDAAGSCREARLLPAAYVHPFLVILRFATEDKRRCAVILPPDSIDPDTHRRLRVQLRLLRGELPRDD